MSFYIGVFDLENRKSKEELINWFKKKSEWDENRDYDSLDETTKHLIDFFMEIKNRFPPMNGDFSPKDEEITEELESYLVDYTICDNLIYMCSAWSVAEEFDMYVKEIANKYKLGVIEFTFDDYIITYNKTYFNSLKEIYDNLNKEINGKMIYKNENGESIKWIIDELNEVYIDGDYFGVNAKIKKKSIITKKEKIVNINIPHWHPDGNFDEIYEEIKKINKYYRNNQNLQEYAKNIRQ